MPGPTVRWRTGGHQLEAASDVLRFEVADINQVIRSSAGNADLYRTIQDRQGHPDGWQVLTMSCFAVTGDWDANRLSTGTGFRAYRLKDAGTIIAAGFELWPTEVFADDVPDPRNEVHYDLVVAVGPELVPQALVSGGPAERRAARAALVPLFERVLAVLGEPIPLTTLPTPPDQVQSQEEV